MSHDGKTVLRGSYNHYVDTYSVPIARQALGEGVSQECRWNAGTQKFDTDCRYTGGARGRTVGLPCGPTGLWPDGTPCAEKVKMPRTIEYTAGIEREVLAGLGVGADLVYRNFVNQYERAETNRIWSGAGTALAFGGSYRSGRPETIDDLRPRALPAASTPASPSA